MKTEAKRSGHSKLKESLILRDALLNELGLELSYAMSQLRAVEENDRGDLEAALDKYSIALLSIVNEDSEQLDELSLSVKTACVSANFRPRYAQYLALLLFAYWAKMRQTDLLPFLARLNMFATTHSSGEHGAVEFTPADLQLAAFWMATAAGKTHVLHACLAMLQGDGWDRILIITPNESLTRQHASQLRRTGLCEVFAYPFDGDASTLGYLAPQVAIVIDINKISLDKKGDGVTIGASAFKFGRNLVFVDEGHRGQRSESSSWKAVQADLAGIGDPESRSRGLLIEFSATFGQVAEAELSFERYSKSIIFDYAYDKFHQDGYGKDFWLGQIQASEVTSSATERQTLSAALLTFWHQISTYSLASSEIAAFQLNVPRPLWVLLGLSVIGGSGQADREQTSDVIQVVEFINDVISDPVSLSRDLTLLKEPTANAILPKEVREACMSWSASALAEQILVDCFGWVRGDRLGLKLLRAAEGELGLGLVRGAECRFFGVINVGDAGGLRKGLESKGLPVDDDALTTSLFTTIDDGDGRITVLIGSRRFAEGWDNYRASCLTLLRLGQSEGALIIQMFGRVVRFHGVSGSGKRLALPSKNIKVIQTAYIYALKSRYLEVFLRGLGQAGVAVRQLVAEVSTAAPAFLSSVVHSVPGKESFAVDLRGTSWLETINVQRISLSASVATSKLHDGEFDPELTSLGVDVTLDFRLWLSVLDKQSIYFDMVAWRRSRRAWNVEFTVDSIATALLSEKYEIVGSRGMMQRLGNSDPKQLERIAKAVVRRLFDAAYRKREKRESNIAWLPALESGIPSEYYVKSYGE